MTDIGGAGYLLDEIDLDDIRINAGSTLQENAMYEITIHKTTVEAVEEGGDWEVIEDRLYTDKEFQNAYTGYDNNPNKTPPTKRVLGYTPKIIKNKTVTIKLFEQTVEVLDLTAVIKAINDIS